MNIMRSISILLYKNITNIHYTSYENKAQNIITLNLKKNNFKPMENDILKNASRQSQ